MLVMLVMKVIFKKEQMFIVIRFAQNIPELLEYGGHRGYLGYLGYLVKNTQMCQFIRLLGNSVQKSSIDFLVMVVIAVMLVMSVI